MLSWSSLAMAWNPVANALSPGDFGRELARLRVGAERGLVELVFLQECVERAALPMMAELDAGDFIRDRTLTFGDLQHLVLGHEQEGRRLIHG